MARAVCAAAFILCRLVLPASAQVPAECATAECARGAPSALSLPAPASSTASDARAVWQEAAQIHELKLRFVAALRVFTEAQSGTFGDEGPELRAAIDAMAKALAAWDAAIASFESRLARLAPDAELDVAAATVLLDRLRVEDALRRLADAERHDDRRPDVYVARALALNQGGRGAPAAAALRTAASLAPDDPAIAYLLAQQERALGRHTEAAEALRTFTRVLARRRPQETSPAEAPPFGRVDLLRETPGVAPLFPMPAYAAGFASLAGGRLSEAIAQFREAASSDPMLANGEAAGAIGAAAEDIRQGRPLPAIERLRPIVAAAPTNGEAHRILGVAHWLGGEQGAAIEQFRAAIALRPDDERARVALADVLAAADRLAEAERELTATISMAPASGRARYRLARLYLRQANLPKAVEMLREAMRVSPPIVGRDFVLQSTAGTLVNQADFEGAVAAHGARVQVSPNSALAHRQIGDVYFLQGRHDEALAEFSAATWLDARDARAHAAIGQVRLRQERYADAAVSLERALSLDDSLQEARYGRATALLRSGKGADGRAQLERFQRQQAESQVKGQLEFELDALRREAGRRVTTPATAVPLLQQALDMDPSNARSHRELGLALVRAGEFESARLHLESAQRADATADVARQLAGLYQRAGMTAESASHLAEHARLVREETLARLRAWVSGP